MFSVQSIIILLNVKSAMEWVKWQSTESANRIVNCINNNFDPYVGQSVAYVYHCNQTCSFTHFKKWLNEIMTLFDASFWIHEIEWKLNNVCFCVYWLPFHHRFTESIKKKDGKMNYFFCGSLNRNWFQLNQMELTASIAKRIMNTYAKQKKKQIVWFERCRHSFYVFYKIGLCLT